MKTNLSNSTAIYGQAMILLSVLSFNLINWFFAQRLDFSVSLFLFDIGLALISTFIIFLAYKTADVSIENKELLIEKFLWSKRIPLEKSIKVRSFFTIGYYLEFEDKRTVYVLFGIDELYKHGFWMESNPTIEKVKLILKREYNKEVQN